MSAECWDVVRVDFPYADELIARPRPALVIATPAATPVFRMVWVLMITSARHAPWPEDVPITNPTTTGLPRPSLIRTAKIATIDSRLVTPIGLLFHLDQHAVAACLKRQLSPVLSL
jgi:mRNA interferase MazF